MSKPTLCLDFDGVLHSYTSGWIAADFLPDPPVPGAIDFLYSAIDHFEVVIFSSRSHQPNGIHAMSQWLFYWTKKHFEPLDWPKSAEHANKIINYFSQGAEKASNEEESRSRWPRSKPSAFLTIDDRALTFTGQWHSINELLAFKPWNKK